MIIQQRIGDVSLWSATLAGALNLAARNALSRDEVSRAAGYKDAGDRNRFLAGRSLLRHALSQAVHGEVAEQDWHYEINAFGKPSVAKGLPQLSFNLSHTGTCVVAAVRPGAPVGVDIERLAQDSRPEIIPDCLTDRETRHLAGLPVQHQWETFVSYWTAKEACAKALGVGVALPFNEIDITLDTPPAAVIHNPAYADCALHLSITSIRCGDTMYRLSLAALNADSPQPD